MCYIFLYNKPCTKPDVIIATETWLGKTTNNNELEMTHYTIYRRNIHTGHAGGVLIAVTKNIRPSVIPNETTSEQIWI